MIKRAFIAFSNKWIIFVSLATTICLFLILNRIDAAVAGSDGMGVIYLQMAFLKDYFIGVVSTWGTEGINLFLKTIWLDFLFPPSYAVLFSSIYVSVSIRDEEYSLESITTFDLICFLMPIFAALFDYLENILHILILLFRLYYNIFTITASTFAFLKWLLLLTSMLMIARKYISVKR